MRNFVLVLIIAVFISTYTLAQDPFFGKVCKLQAKHSGKVADVSGSSQSNGANIHQWDFDSNWPSNGRSNQLFYLFRLTDRTYAIVAKHSGKVFDVSGRSKSNGANIHQWDWAGIDNQRFYLEKFSDSTYRITPKHSGKSIDVSGNNEKNGANIHQWDFDSNWSSNGRGNQRFEIIPVDSVSFRNTSKSAVPEAPRLTNRHLPTSGSKTGFGVMGSTWLPFIQVQDREKSQTWKAQHSPYYELVRERYYAYREEISKYNGSSGEDSVSTTVTTGSSKEQRKTFSLNTGISVTTEAGVDVGVVSANVSATVYVDLGWSSESAFTSSFEESQTDTYSIPPHSTIAIWIPVDVYTLKRLDGTVVNSWEVTGNSTYKMEFKHNK